MNALIRPARNYALRGEQQARRNAQRLAARRDWGHDKHRELRWEFLAYSIREAAGAPETGKAVLCNRTYAPIWLWIPAQATWHPVFPWEAHESPDIHRLAHEREDDGRPAPQRTFFYDDAWCLYPQDGRDPRRDTDVSLLAARVESQLAAMGYPQPDWFAHPGPPDSIIGRPFAERRECYALDDFDPTPFLSARGC